MELPGTSSFFFSYFLSSVFIETKMENRLWSHFVLVEGQSWLWYRTSYDGWEKETTSSQVKTIPKTRTENKKENV